MKIELYHLQDCPFSAKVRDFVEKNDLKDQITYHDVGENEDDMKALVELTDDEQVPCLVVEGRPIHESDEIIDWLKENVVDQNAA
ncbi:MAG: glutathione S-transferase N-terminal domain-containing protein [Methylotenera sp.]|nr:glutathione S-transferase N-terminal domain-containing protein [Oligoflexia bacterium]